MTQITPLHLPTDQERVQAQATLIELAQGRLFGGLSEGLSGLVQRLLSEVA